MEIEVREAALDNPQVSALALDHVRQMRAGSPPGQAFALDLRGLDDPAITLFGAWRGDDLLGIGALKRLGAEGAEIKSMRTRADALRQGVARALLEAIIARARDEGMARLSLETGDGPAFEPALAL
ncbi:GNAT family N-acetyltransferase [Citromicrobium bathyomarinum]|uniref:GNAT family N-acetyltransferase n=1 Tax=Citromicrobium bathyomarinum TaxID=72174 RepID=UPI00315A9403